ncbi:MAG TPA: 7-cyano-7-deazaguanine synthase [Pirellulales bacterium]|jgi:7-cyano-7-deazaguanine synthase
MGTIGVLVSGGLDSAILVSHLLEQGEAVQPFYIECGLSWQAAELAALQRYLAVIAAGSLSPLVTLQLPLADLYAGHWSLTGKQIPDAATPDEAVYLPGRNLLLAIKPALWCQMHGIGRLALGVLGSNPFDDATAEFFAALENVLARLGQPQLEIVRPFAGIHKREVMEIGRDYPLGLTFSCIDPVDGLHCGRCNKCAERRGAFRLIKMADPTRYAGNSG